MAGSQIDDPYDRFQAGHSQTAKVAIVSQDDPVLRARPAEDDEIVGTDETTFLDVQKVVAALSQQPNDLRMNVFIRQEGEIPQPQ